MENVKGISSFDANDFDKMQEVYVELCSLRLKLTEVANKDEREEILKKIADYETKYNDVVENFSEKYGLFEQEIIKYTEMITEKEKQLLVNISKYETIYNEMKRLKETQANKLSDPSITTKEKEQIKGDYEKQIQAKSQELSEINISITVLKKELESLVKNRNKSQKDLDAAISLGLTAPEYREFTTNSRNLMNSILEKKGLKEILDIKYSDRTKEQRDILAAARLEVKQEIAEAMKSLRAMDESISVEDLIDILYFDDEKVVEQQMGKVLVISQKDIIVLRERVKTATVQKVKKKTTGNNPTKTPQPRPSDMQSTTGITPTPSATSTPTSTPSGTPTPTPSMTPTPSVSITPSVTPSMTPTPSAVSTPTPTPSMTPSVTPSPKAAKMVTVYLSDDNKYYAKKSVIDKFGLVIWLMMMLWKKSMKQEQIVHHHL